MLHDMVVAFFRFMYSIRYTVFDFVKTLTMFSLVISFPPHFACLRRLFTGSAPSAGLCVRGNYRYCRTVVRRVTFFTGVVRKLQVVFCLSSRVVSYD